MVNMKTKTFYGVEYTSGNRGQTYDIFPTLKQARAFSKNIFNFCIEYKPLFIFKADFNVENIYTENDLWNYEDYSNTIVRYHKYYKTFSDNISS